MIGDIVGKGGRKTLKLVLPEIIKKENIDFVIAQGENSAGGFGLTMKTSQEFFDSGVNVITSGNHIWDQKKIMEFIAKEERLLRPNNFFDGSPGTGLGIYKVDNKKERITIIQKLQIFHPLKHQKGFFDF